MEKKLGCFSFWKTSFIASKSKEKWSGKQKIIDPYSFFIDEDAILGVPTLPPSSSSSSSTFIEEAELIEAENVQSKHAYSVALATAAAAEAAVAAAQAAAEVVRLATVVQFSEKSNEEMAAIKIQAAIRGHLARQALWGSRRLARLKALMQGKYVRKQAAMALRSLQALTELQSQICARRIRLHEQSWILQKKLQQNQEEIEEEEQWDDSMQSKEKIKVNLLLRQEAALRRERALAYAFSHQGQSWKSNARPTSSLSFMVPSSIHWGWSWMERQPGFVDGASSSIRTTTNKQSSKPQKSHHLSQCPTMAEDEQHSSGGSAVNAPNYMSPTVSAKAKSKSKAKADSCLPSPLQASNWSPVDEACVGYDGTRKRLSFSSPSIDISSRAEEGN